MNSRGKPSVSIRPQSSSSATIRSHKGDTCEPLLAENFSFKKKTTWAERVSVLCTDSDAQNVQNGSAHVDQRSDSTAIETK